MGSELQESLLRVAPFAVGVLILGLLVALRPESRERLAWKPVPARVLVRWLLLWAAWVAATELLAQALGRPSPGRLTAHGAALAIRVVGIVVLAPLLEELVFRGILFRLLLPWAGPGPTVVGTALLFALSHGQYSALELVQVLADGVVLGLARLRTGSTRVPFWMHLLGNAFALWQHLRPW